MLEFKEIDFLQSTGYTLHSQNASSRWI